MTATTIAAPVTASPTRATIRIAVAVTIALVLLVAAFAVGRATASSRTTSHPVVTVPSGTATGSAQLCDLGRAC